MQVTWHSRVFFNEIRDQSSSTWSDTNMSLNELKLISINFAGMTMITLPLCQNQPKVQAYQTSWLKSKIMIRVARIPCWHAWNQNGIRPRKHLVIRLMAASWTNFGRNLRPGASSQIHFSHSIIFEVFDQMHSELETPRDASQASIRMKYSLLL